MPGVSDASTVPAQTPEALRNAMTGTRLAALEAESQLKTPPAQTTKIERETSAPKLSRAIQSKAVLGGAAGHKGVPTAKCKAKAKAKAKGVKTDPETKASSSSGRKAPAAPRQQLATAVKESLHRCATGDLASSQKVPKKDAKKPAKTDKKDSTDKEAAKVAAKKRKTTESQPESQKEDLVDSEASPSHESEDPQYDEEELERVRAKKAHHALFMKFSRSLKSNLVQVNHLAQSTCLPKSFASAKACNNMLNSWVY